MRRGIILSLMLHLGAFFVVWVNVPDLFPEPEVKPIKIRMVSAPDVKKTTKKEVKKVKTQQSAAPKKAPEPKKKEVKQTKPKNPTKVVKAEPKKTEPKKAPPEPKPEKPKQEEVKKAENKPRPEKLDKTPDKKNVIKDKSEDAKTVEKDDFLAALDFVDDLEDKQSALTQGAKKTEATTLDLAAQAELAKLKEHIEGNWYLPPGIKESEDLETHVELILNPDGTINTMKVTRRSGVEFFDNSLLRAIRKSVPLPIPQDKYELFKVVDLRFKKS